MMRLSRFLPTLIALAVSAGAQTAPLAQNALTNQDVVTLAKAGFNEDFIIDTIAMSRTRFDTTLSGVAELAKEGLTERLIRTMMAASPPPPAPVPAAVPSRSATPKAATAAPAVAAEPRGDPRTKGKTTVDKPSAMLQAVATQTPYYEWTSMAWGLYSKKVGVGAVPRGEQGGATSLGGFFNQVRLPVTRSSPVAPQPPNP